MAMFQRQRSGSSLEASDWSNYRGSEVSECLDTVLARMPERSPSGSQTAGRGIVGVMVPFCTEWNRTLMISEYWCHHKKSELHKVCNTPWYSFPALCAPGTWVCLEESTDVLLYTSPQPLASQAPKQFIPVSHVNISTVCIRCAVKRVGKHCIRKPLASIHEKEAKGKIT